MRFGFLMYPGYEELDLIGPWEIAAMWSTYAGGPTCVTVGETTAEIRCAKGLITRPAASFDDVGRLDAVLVPGGFTAFEERGNPATLDFLRRTAGEGATLLSVCSGTFLLHAAGLLDGVRATTNWKVLGALRNAGVSVLEERWVRDGRVWSSAGVSAGIDMMLAFVADRAGAEAAWVTQYQAEYLPDGRLYGSVDTWDGAPAYARRLAATNGGDAACCDI